MLWTCYAGTPLRPGCRWCDTQFAPFCESGLLRRILTASTLRLSPRHAPRRSAGHQPTRKVVRGERVNLLRVVKVGGNDWIHVSLASGQSSLPPTQGYMPGKTKGDHFTYITEDETAWCCHKCYTTTPDAQTACSKCGASSVAQKDYSWPVKVKNQSLDIGEKIARIGNTEGVAMLRAATLRVSQGKIKIEVPLDIGGVPRSWAICRRPRFAKCATVNK